MTRSWLTDLGVNPLRSLMCMRHSAIEMHRQHVLWTGLLPRVTITQPIVSFLHLINSCPRIKWFWYLKKTLRLFDQLTQYKAKVNVYLSMNVLYSFGLPASHWWSSDWRCQTHNECHIHMPPNPEMPLSPKNKLKENAHYNQVVYSTTSVVFLF